MISNSYYKFLDWQIKNLAIDASPYDHCTFHYDRETKSYVDDGCLVVCWYKVIKDEDGNIRLEYNHMETVKEYEDKYKEKFGTIEDVGENFIILFQHLMHKSNGKIFFGFLRFVI